MILYQVDAFTDSLFGGNPAAVIPLQKWPDDALMQNIAAENNLAETAFIVPEEDAFRIRWFTPMIEVDLCGHATLAAGYVLFTVLGYSKSQIVFLSKSGPLTVTHEVGDWLTLNFPADHYEEVDITKDMKAITSAKITAAFKGNRDYMFVLEDQDAVVNSEYDHHAIAQLGHAGIIVTAPGKDVDFVSRFFAPAFGIPEDPVTGSAHTTLIPYWANKLNKSSLIARQLSPRRGYLRCELQGDRVLMSGKAVMYMKGDLYIDWDKLEIF
jgi:PhzF family phenazine biosynthesis protein